MSAETQKLADLKLIGEKILSADNTSNQVMDLLEEYNDFETRLDAWTDNIDRYKVEI